MLNAFALSMLVLSPLSSLPSAAAPTGGDCDSRLRTSPVATEPNRTAEDGRLLVEIDYSTETPGTRTVELPAILSRLRGRHRLKLVVLAGNTGDEFEGTRHNLAFAFGDHVFANFDCLVSTSDDFSPARETVMVPFDDGTFRPWTTTFTTETPYARTCSGEAFYVPNLNGAPALVLRMIGDYNEVGDFAIPILDGLDLPSTDLVLVHDDLGLVEGDSRLTTEVQKYNGNNAQYSLIRNLAYGAWPRVRAALGARAQLTDAEWTDLERGFRARANVRYANHLGDDKAFASAFKNVDAVLAALVPTTDAVADRMVAPIKAELDELQAQMTAAKQPMAALQTELTRPDVTTERRAELLALRDRIQSDTKPLGVSIKQTRARVDAVRKELVVEVRRIVAERLTFSRLAIGTDDGRIDRSDLAGFVLSPYAPEAFGPEVWSAAVERLTQWLKN